MCNTFFKSCASNQWHVWHGNWTRREWMHVLAVGMMLWCCCVCVFFLRRMSFSLKTGERNMTCCAVLKWPYAVWSDWNYLFGASFFLWMFLCVRDSKQVFQRCLLCSVHWLDSIIYTYMRAVPRMMKRFYYFCSPLAEKWCIWAYRFLLDDVMACLINLHVVMVVLFNDWHLDGYRITN